MVISGLGGAAASVLGKMACSPDNFVIQYTSHYICTALLINDQDCWPVRYLIQGVCALLMLYANALMLSNFLKSLESRGSLPVTVVWFELSSFLSISCNFFSFLSILL